MAGRRTVGIETIEVGSYARAVRVGRTRPCRCGTTPPTGSIQLILNARSGARGHDPRVRLLHVRDVWSDCSLRAIQKEMEMSNEQSNKEIVGRWFTSFWGKNCDLGIIDKLAAPDMLLQYSLHAPRRGRADIKAFMTGFREAFPDLAFIGAADLIAEGEYVVGRWKGGGTHTGTAFSDFLIGSLPAATGRKMYFTGTTVLRVVNGLITEEVGLDDGVTALQQLDLIRVK
jgi:predicted ester cyclase